MALYESILLNTTRPFYMGKIPARTLALSSKVSTRQLLSSSNRSTNNLFKFKFINNTTNTNDMVSTKNDSTTPNIKKWTSHSLPTNDKLSFIKSPPPSAQTGTSSSNNKAATPDTTDSAGKKRKRKLRARKAVITLTPNAIIHLKALLNLPEPKLIRVSTKNRGCSGTTYDLSYVTKPEKFDEVVEQDGVKIIIDSKALFSVLGSEMDWIDDKLNSKFIFQNPNSKGTCGCGESFMT